METNTVIITTKKLIMCKRLQNIISAFNENRMDDVIVLRSGLADPQCNSLVVACWDPVPHMS